MRLTALTIRETPAHRFDPVRRSDIPRLWHPSRSWLERVIDWWHGGSKR